MSATPATFAPAGVSYRVDIKRAYTYVTVGNLVARIQNGTPFDDAGDVIDIVVDQLTRKQRTGEYVPASGSEPGLDECNVRVTNRRTGKAVR
jgi:hypothetical protein